MEETQNEETRAKLKVNRGVPLDGASKPCPACEAGMPPDAVICVKCGYDTRSGSSLKTSSHVTHTLLVLIATIISLLVAAAAIVVLINFFKSDPAMPPVPAVEPTQQVDPVMPEEPGIPIPEDPLPIPPPPLQEEEEREEKKEEEPVPAESDVSAGIPPVDERVDDAGAEDEVPEADPVDAMREELRRSLDERVPMVEVGDEVALRRVNGFVHRGTLVAIRDGMALVVAGELRERVPLNELDRDSRILVDTNFRERLVESRLRALHTEDSF